MTPQRWSLRRTAPRGHPRLPQLWRLPHNRARRAHSVPNLRRGVRERLALGSSFQENDARPRSDGSPRPAPWLSGPAHGSTRQDLERSSPPAARGPRLQQASVLLLTSRTLPDIDALRYTIPPVRL